MFANARRLAKARVIQENAQVFLAHLNDHGRPLVMIRETTKHFSTDGKSGVAERRGFVRFRKSKREYTGAAEQLSGAHHSNGLSQTTQGSGGKSARAIWF